MEDNNKKGKPGGLPFLLHQAGLLLWLGGDDFGADLVIGCGRNDFLVYQIRLGLVRPAVNNFLRIDIADSRQRTQAALLAELISTRAGAAGGVVCAIMAWTTDGLAFSCAVATPPRRPNVSRMVRLFCDRTLNFALNIYRSPSHHLESWLQAQCYTNLPAKRYIMRVEGSEET